MTPKDKRLARLRAWTDQALQQSKQRAARRVKEIGIVQKEREKENHWRGWARATGGQEARQPRL